jgi:hypothetical protein
MSRIFRFIAEAANFFHGMFGHGAKQPFSRQSLEDLVGRRAARVVMAVPVVTVTLWLALWVAAKLFDLPEGSDPFAWFRNIGGE